MVVQHTASFPPPHVVVDLVVLVVGGRIPCWFDPLSFVAVIQEQ